MRFLHPKEIENIFSDTEKHYPFPFSENYLKIISSNNIESKVLVDEKEEIFVPLKFQKSRFIKIAQLLFTPFSFDKKIIGDDLNNFLTELISFLSTEGSVDRIIAPPNYVLFVDSPKWVNSCRFGTYFLDLSKSEDDLFMGMHSKHRNVIRNAIKKGVETSYGKDVIDDFYELYKKTMQRSNMYCENKGYFVNLVKLEKEIICGVAYYQGTPIGGLMNHYTKHSCYYRYGASADQIYPNGSINYLHWEVIKKMKKLGVAEYNFVGARLTDVTGTKLEGIQKFKVRFGASLRKGYLWKYDCNVINCKLYDILITLKSILSGNSKPYDIIDQENNKIENKERSITDI